MRTIHQCGRKGNQQQLDHKSQVRYKLDDASNDLKISSLKRANLNLNLEERTEFSIEKNKGAIKPTDKGDFGRLIRITI